MVLQNKKNVLLSAPDKGKRVRPLSGLGMLERAPALCGVCSEVTDKYLKIDGVTAAADPKSVVFIPLSPKSSRTLKEHHREMANKDEDEDEPDRRAESDRDDVEPATRAVDDSETDGSSGGGGGQLVPSSGYYLAHPRSRRLSDPSSDRRRRPRRTARSYTPDSDEEDVIEVLPDRFDAQGRPLDGRSRSVVAPGGRLHSRRGEFEYRPPRPGGGGLNVRGQWGVAGTDERQVERIVRKVTGVVEGRESVLGLLGGLLSGKLLEDSDSSGEGDEGRTKGKRRRREAIEDRYDYDDDRGERRRRRRRGSE